MGEKKLWDDMKKIKPTRQNIKNYQNYVISGGEASFEQWKKENKN